MVTPRYRCSVSLSSFKSSARASWTTRTRPSAASSTCPSARRSPPAPAADAKAVARSKATAEDWARIRLDTNEWTTSDAEVSVPVDQVDPFAMHQAMGQDKPHLGADAMDTSLEAEPALLTLAPSLEVAQELIDAAAASAPAPDGAPAAPVDDSPAALICPVPVRGGAVVVFRGAVRLAASASGGAEGVAEPAPRPRAPLLSPRRAGGPRGAALSAARGASVA